MATTSEVSVNVRDHGMALDDQKKRVKCNYCGKVVSGFSRLKYHLGKIRGDVAPCQAVPAELKELIRNELLNKKKGSLSKEVGSLSHPDLPLKRNWCTPSNSVNHKNPESSETTASGNNKRGKVDCMSESTESGPSRKRRLSSQGAVNGLEVDSSVRQVQKCIGQFFYETGIDIDAVASPSFQRMMDAAFTCGQVGYKIPSCQELKGPILEDELKEMNMYVKDIRNSWASTGCSVILDGWIDRQGRNLINILADCPRGPIYLRSYDISDSIEDVQLLQSLLDEVIEEVGVENLVQIVTFSTSATMDTVGQQLMDKHRTFFWTVSASHCIGLMLEKLGTMVFIKKTLEKAKTMAKFIQNHSKLLKLFKQFTDGCDLVKPYKIRAAVPFLTLENIVSEREILEQLFSSSEWNFPSQEGKKVADLVSNRTFWSEATTVLNSTIPLVRVLDLIHEDDRPQLCYIYETLDQAKETIKKQLKNKTTKYEPVWNAIDEIWNTHLHSPLHSAGYFLNPCLFYASDFFSDSEVAGGLLHCIVSMVRDKQVQDMVSSQVVDEYRGSKGGFGRGRSKRSNITPAEWWSKYGGDCPELQRFAIRILSQTCNGASKYDLKRSLAEKLLTKGRNRVEQQRLRDLTFVHYNLQLRNFGSGVRRQRTSFEEIDPMDDWMVDRTEESTTQVEFVGGNASTSAGEEAGNEEQPPPSTHPKAETD